MVASSVSPRVNLVGYFDARSKTLERDSLDDLQHVEAFKKRCGDAFNATVVVDREGVAKPAWSGRRVFSVVPDATPAIDSPYEGAKLERSPSPPGLAKLLGDAIRPYPSALTILDMWGHGWAYESSAGMKYPDFKRVLGDVTAAVGKPVDLYVGDVCLQSNLEALSSLQSNARYAVLSELNTRSCCLTPLIGLATESGATTPEEFGRRMIAEAPTVKQKVPRSEPAGTLALIDMAKVPSLQQAVGRLGELLAADVRNGNAGVMKKIIEGTPDLEDSERATPDLADLRGFVNRVDAAYSGAAVAAPKKSIWREIACLPRKWEKTTWPMAASSPRATDIRQAVADVKQGLDACIVSRYHAPAHAALGGISIQMPGDGISPRNYARYSGAPRGWASFVSEMTGRMQRW